MASRVNILYLYYMKNGYILSVSLLFKTAAAFPFTHLKEKKK